MGRSIERWAIPKGVRSMGIDRWSHSIDRLMGDLIDEEFNRWALIAARIDESVQSMGAFDRRKSSIDEISSMGRSIGV